MNAADWEKVKAIIEEAAKLPLAERASFVNGLCTGQPEISAEVGRLLPHYDQLEGFLSVPLPEQRSADGYDLPAGNAKLKPGDLLAGRFRIVTFLACGGMGEIYEAEDLLLRDRVALKTMRPDIAGDHRMIERFKREIQAAKSIAHPNVCRIHDLHVHPNSEPGSSDLWFLTMELLRGPTLAEELRGHGAMRVSEALPIVRQVASGLAAAHALGIVHRDLKPSNIMLVSQPDSGKRRAVLTDFGLARQPSSGLGAGPATESGQILGTPSYMAPEQLLGRQAGPASDVYSFGIVLFEMVTGHHPFAADTPFESAAKRLSDSAPSPCSLEPSLPISWDRAILRCLESDPARRFASAPEILETLDEDDAARVVPRKRRGRPWPRMASRAWPKRKLWAILSAAVVLAGIGALVVSKVLTPARSPAAVRWYEAGEGALRDGTYFRAMNMFERSIHEDAGFRLAHARLAEAAAELDYADVAKTEILRAFPPWRGLDGLSATDRLLLGAIQSTVTHDFAAAIPVYAEIEQRASGHEKAALALDLGRAKENNQDVDGALRSYLRSASLDRQYAAAFLRAGILYRRSSDYDNAKKYFDQAEELYRAESNAEGLTEVVYQRGAMLNKMGKGSLARPLLQEAFNMALHTSNDHQQVRTLLQLSNVSYMEGDTERGRKEAEQAVALARDKKIEALAVSGLVDLGSALYIKGAFGPAETYLRNALEMAARFDVARTQARASFALANLLLKQDRTEEGLRQAGDALKFYARSGYKIEAARTAIQIGRAFRQKGDFDTALKIFRDQIRASEQMGDRAGLPLGHDGAGSVLLKQERYPEALKEFEQSQAINREMNDAVGAGYTSLNRANAYWHMGMYEQARTAFGEAEKVNVKVLAAGIHQYGAEMALSQRDFEQARLHLRKLAESTSGTNLEAAAEGARIRALVETASGKPADGVRLAKNAVAAAGESGDPNLVARARLALALSFAQSSRWKEAWEIAVPLESEFKRREQVESQWLTCLLQARAGSGLKDRAGAQESAARASENLTMLETLWGADVYRSYCARPDVQEYRSQLERLIKLKRP
jgi:tetratricopeptide (TPR) repeat protein